MADFGNIAGIVKSFTEPLDQNGNPKTFIIWAREVTSGSSAVELLRYDFVRSKWIPLSAVSSVFKAHIAVTTNLNSFSSISTLDGRNLQDNDRVLLTAQTDNKQNGLYLYNDLTNTLVRSSSFSQEIPGDHIIYILSGTSSGSLYVSVNISGSSFLTVGTDNINYSKLNSSSTTPVGNSASSDWTILNTNDPTATNANYTTRLVTIINSLPAFTIPISVDIIIKHIYITPAIETGGETVRRLAYFKLNRPSAQTQFGVGNSPITIGNLVQTNPNYILETIFHPDGISINGMGDYTLGNSQYNLQDGNDLTQHNFNKKAAQAIKDVFEGKRITKFGQLDIKKIEGNLDDSIIEPGDRVVNSNLNNDIFLYYGDYVSGNELNLSSYDPNTSSFYDPNDI